MMTNITDTEESAAGVPAHRVKRHPRQETRPHLIRGLWCAVVLACEGFSEKCRLVRAYNDLTRLDDRTLHAIGSNREELERILAGHTPQKHRNHR